MYDSDKGAVSSALKAGNSPVFNTQVVEKILSLVTNPGKATVAIEKLAVDVSGTVVVPTKADMVMIGSSDTARTVIKSELNAPVLIFEGKGGVDVVINAGQATVPAGTAGASRVIVGSAGKDKIVIADKIDTMVTLGTGPSTVVAGAGNDTIVAGLGDATIVGGGGYDIVKMDGKASDYKVKVVDGRAVVTDAKDGKTADISKIQFVQLDGGDALVFAKDAKQAAVAQLYQAAFGRAADADGLKFWFDAANNGVSLEKIAKDFVTSTEYKANLNPTQSNEEFLQKLYKQLFNRDADAEGLAWWDAAMKNGATRDSVMAGFVAAAAANLDGTLNTEATIVGSVTVIGTII